MKTRFLVLTGLSFSLLACGMLGGSSKIVPPTETPVPEMATSIPEPSQTPRSPEDVQAQLIAEWRPAYNTSIILPTILNRIWYTNFNFTEGRIDLEQARLELEAEATLLDYARQILSSVTAPSEEVAPYLDRLNTVISTMSEVVESGDAALEGDAFEIIDAEYDSVSILRDEIPDAAKVAGMTNESIYALNDEIFPMSDKLHDDDEWMVAIPKPTAGPLEQEGLKDNWRPAYNPGALLFETCTMTYQTHADFGQGVINLERARDELEVEAEFVEYVLRDITSVVPQNEKVASHVLKIEAQASSLTEWLEPKDNDIGTTKALAAIDAVCSSLQSRMNAIFKDAKSAGMSADSFGELDTELSPMIADLYNRTWYGR
jgi:hypothetical protein